ncbi:MAG TPA: bifunctional adenosylcobinamide kinase/adenosylcobinamide-phosphate guanylyltransferase [Syntrophales bacterium]|nr:bifunctional adenosylcobinamide kinase/adenosylcobinamide-phosphate guanylyltransferase [Syntrophales bacterium]
MKARVFLVTGGARSGKSTFAQGLAESLSRERTYIATCPVLDEELAARVAIHRRAREGRSWRTLEEERDLAGALGLAPEGVVLVDCLTLWVNNLMYDADSRGLSLTEGDMAALAGGVVQAARARRGDTVLVTNEVGMGIVPDNYASRLFRDLAGRCNQIVAAGADAVVFMVSGIPLWIKGDQAVG